MRKSFSRRVTIIWECHPDPLGWIMSKKGYLDDFYKKAQLVNYDSHRAMFESWNSND